MKNKNDKSKPRKPNIILLAIRNCAKFLLAEYCFFTKIPEIDFKKLSTNDLAAELSKSKPKRRKILYKKHSILLKNINKKFKDNNIAPDQNDNKVKILIDDGWNEQKARDLLLWELGKNCAIVSLSKQGLGQGVKDVKSFMRDYYPDSTIDLILEELLVDDIFIISISLDKGIRIYL